MNEFSSVILLISSGLLLRLSLTFTGQAWAKSHAQTVAFMILPVITYVITKTQNHYTIRSSYVDYWKYPIKKKHNKKINNRRNKNY